MCIVLLPPGVYPIEVTYIITSHNSHKDIANHFGSEAEEYLVCGL